MGVDREDVVEMLDEEHQRFSSQFGFDPVKGVVDGERLRYRDYDVRYSTQPYVGSKYGDKPRILFIGLNQGKEWGPAVQPMEWTDKVQSQYDDISLRREESRREAIEDEELECHNAHITGTASMALNIFEDDMDPSKLPCTKEGLDEFPTDRLDYNPLSYVALINAYKFVKAGKGTREEKHIHSFIKISDLENTSTLQESVLLSQHLQAQHLINQVKALQPEHIIFQGSVDALSNYLAKYAFSSDFIQEAKVQAMYHPSFRYRNTLQDLLDTTYGLE